MHSQWQKYIVAYVRNMNTAKFETTCLALLQKGAAHSEHKCQWKVQIICIQTNCNWRKCISTETFGVVSIGVALRVLEFCYLNWIVEPDLVSGHPWGKNSISSQPLSKIYYLYFLVLLPCTDSTLIQLGKISTVPHILNGTFRKWVILSNWALWPRLWPPIGWGGCPKRVLLD